MKGSYNMPNMPKSLTSNNSGIGGVPSGPVPQTTGNLSTGRFSSNNNPATVSQLSPGGINGHSGIASRGGINVLGNQTFSNGMNGFGGSVPAGSASGSVGIRGSVPVLGASGLVGNVASRISSHAESSARGFGTGNNLGRTISNAREVAVPGLRTHVNAAQNNVSGSIHVQGPGRQMSNIFQQGSLRNQSIGVNSIVQQNHEFRIQNEDFPALQRCKGNFDFANDLHQKEQNHENAIAMRQSQHFPMVRSAGFSLGGTYVLNRQPQHQQQKASGLSTNHMGTTFVSGNSPDIRLHGSELFSSSPAISNSYFNQAVPNVHSGAPNNVMRTYDQLVQQHQRQTEYRLQQIPGVSQLGGDQGFRPLQGPQPPSDQFGLLGLINVLRMTNPDLTSLALGIDPEKLGLQLDPSVKLYRTFGSPWSAESVKAEPEYRLPECYVQEAPRLHESRPTRFRERTLFYMFYSMPKDEAQLYAANELHNRGWFYHGDLRLWFKRVENMELLVKTHTYERGSYLVFDPLKWQTYQKDNFVVQYEKLERRPPLPQHYETM